MSTASATGEWLEVEPLAGDRTHNDSARAWLALGIELDDDTGPTDVDAPGIAALVRLFALIELERPDWQRDALCQEYADTVTWFPEPARAPSRRRTFAHGASWRRNAPPTPSRSASASACGPDRPAATSGGHKPRSSLTVHARAHPTGSTPCTPPSAMCSVQRAPSQYLSSCRPDGSVAQVAGTSAAGGGGTGSLGGSGAPPDGEGGGPVGAAEVFVAAATAAAIASASERARAASASRWAALFAASAFSHFFRHFLEAGPVNGSALPVSLYSPQVWHLSFFFVTSAPTPTSTFDRSVRFASKPLFPQFQHRNSPSESTRMSFMAANLSHQSGTLPDRRHAERTRLDARTRRTPSGAPRSRGHPDGTSTTPARLGSSRHPSDSLRALYRRPPDCHLLPFDSMGTQDDRPTNDVIGKRLTITGVIATVVIGLYWFSQRQSYDNGNDILGGIIDRPSFNDTPYLIAIGVALGVALLGLIIQTGNKG